MIIKTTIKRIDTMTEAQLEVSTPLTHSKEETNWADYLDFTRFPFPGEVDNSEIISFQEYLNYNNE
jgi:hypothetical protein